MNSIFSLLQLVKEMFLSGASSPSVLRILSLPAIWHLLSFPLAIIFNLFLSWFYVTSHLQWEVLESRVWEHHLRSVSWLEPLYNRWHAVLSALIWTSHLLVFKIYWTISLPVSHSWMSQWLVPGPAAASHFMGPWRTYETCRQESFAQ